MIRKKCVYTININIFHKNFFFLLLKRDIKCANILIDGNSVIKLTDFGTSAKLIINKNKN